MDKYELHTFIARRHPNICQIAAVKNGKLVYSDTWNGYGREDTVHAASVTKSVFALLMGIAVDRGLIESVSQKVLEFFPQYMPQKGEQAAQNVTLHHLMTMTAPYKYLTEPWTEVCTSGDWTLAALDLLGGQAGPDGGFNYSTLGIQILSGILSAVGGMTALDFANEHLFMPLGIAPRRAYIAAGEAEQMEFITSAGPKSGVWLCDPRGIPAAGFGLCLSAEEMCRLGLLCLNGGAAGGRRIVSSGWIAGMTTPYVECGEAFGHMKYGYLWWIPAGVRGAFAAMGDGGSIIYVEPGRKTVISIAAAFEPLTFDRTELVQECLEPFMEGSLHV